MQADRLLGPEVVDVDGNREDRSDTVSVYLNNGNGTFASQVTYATGSFPISVTSADFNKDGLVDGEDAVHALELTHRRREVAQVGDGL